MSLPSTFKCKPDIFNRNPVSRHVIAVPNNHISPPGWDCNTVMLHHFNSSLLQLQRWQKGRSKPREFLTPFNRLYTQKLPITRTTRKSITERVLLANTNFSSQCKIISSGLGKFTELGLLYVLNYLIIKKKSMS